MAEKSEGLEKGEYVIGIAIILSALLVSATFYFAVSGIEKAVSSLKLAVPSGSSASGGTQQGGTGTQSSQPSEVKLYVVSDKRCQDCGAAATQIAAQLKTMFPGLISVQHDYLEPSGKALYAEAGGNEALPMFLFEDSVKSAEGYASISQYFVKAGKYQLLQVGSQFDPTAEICGNSMDDDSNGLSDCADPACKSDITCMEKTDKPKVELFVMSYCPYGTQIEKGILPVVDLLGSKVDWNIRFVYYIMHGEKEVRENQLQYCMQAQNKSKYFEYLRCFLNSSNSDACLASTGMSKAQFQKCYDEADKKFNLTADFQNTATYLNGQYPLFGIDAALNKKYKVLGSPAFVINGVQNKAQGRDPNSMLKTVCMAFKQPPAECAKALSTQTYTSGFGFDFQPVGAVASGGCG
jgi:hypothetical protein